MTREDDFIARIQEMTKPELDNAKIAADNREAIEYLAGEIRDLREQVREIEKAQGYRERERSHVTERPSSQETVESGSDNVAELEEKIEKMEQVIREIIQRQGDLIQEIVEEKAAETVETKEDEPETGEVETDKREVSLAPFTATQEKLLKHLAEIEEWKTSTELAKETDFSTQEIRNLYTPLKEKADVIETNKNLGVKLKDDVRLVQSTETEKTSKDYECIICGDEFPSGKGLAGHIGNGHDVELPEPPEDVKTSDYINAKGKTEQEISEIKDQLGEVSTPKDKDRDFPRFEKGEKIDDPTHWEIPERRVLTKRILRNAEKPLTRYEIAERLYNLDETPTFGDKHSNAVTSYIKKMEDEAVINEAERMDTDSKAYALAGSSNDVGTLEAKEPEKKNIDEDVPVSDATKQIEKRREDIDARREFNSLKNTFTKLVHQEGKEEISFYDFSGNYGGEQQTLEAFRLLFSSPNILNGIRKEVCPDKSLKWKAKGEGKNPSNWVLEVK